MLQICSVSEVRKNIHTRNVLEVIKRTRYTNVRVLCNRNFAGFFSFVAYLSCLLFRLLFLLRYFIVAHVFVCMRKRALTFCSCVSAHIFILFDIVHCLWVRDIFLCALPNTLWAMYSIWFWLSIQVDSF